MKKNLSEILFRSGELHEEWQNTVSPPVYQSSNFCFPTVKALRNAFHEEKEKPLYTRGVNPTVSVLRKKLAELENTEDALVLSSGAAAISSAVLHCVQSGDHILCVAHPYSWAQHLMGSYLKRFGVDCTFSDAKDTDVFLSGIRENTRLIYLESPNSLTFEIQDLGKIAARAKEKNILTICDNSYASPLGQTPSAFGIDIVVHSATKYINGHSDVVSGVICSTKKRIQAILGEEYMTLGAIASPMESWLILRGMRTLQLRLEKSADTAQRVFEFLKKRKEVEQIYYPHDPDSPQYELCIKQMHYPGGLLSVCIKAGSIAEMERFSNALKFFRMAVSWGGYESLQLPVCSFYSRENEKHHLPWNMVRLYFGLEQAEDLLDDLEQAFREMKKN